MFPVMGRFSMTRDFFLKKNGESISDTGSYTLSEIRNVELKGKKSEMFQSAKSAVELFAPARTSSPHAVKENLFFYATLTPVSTTTSRRLRPLPPFAASAGRPPSRRWEAPALRSGRRPAVCLRLRSPPGAPARPAPHLAGPVSVD